MRTLALLLVVVGVAADAPGSDGNAPVRVMATKLVDAYEENEAFADENYTDKVVEVTGKVIRVRRSPFQISESGRDYVATVYSDKVPNPDRLPIYFLFEGKQRKELVDLKPFQTVTIRGLCLGREGFLGAGGGPVEPPPTGIWFRECKVVAKEK